MDNAILIEKTRQLLLMNADVLPLDLCSLANAWVAIKDHRMAHALYNKAYTLAPNDDVVMEAYVSFLCALNKQREALDLLLHAHNDINYSAARIGWIHTLAHLKSTDDIDFPILKDFQHYCLENNIPVKQVAASETLYLSPIHSFPKTHTDTLHGFYDTHPVYMAEVPNAIVTAESHAFFAGDSAIREEFSLLHRDDLVLNDERDKLIIYIPTLRSPAKRGIANKRMVDEEVEELVLNLIGSTCSNYYHWLIEWVPRIMVLDEINEPVKLLIRKQVPEQFKEIIRVVTGGRYQILESGTDNCVSVKRLIHTNGWATMPCDIRADKRPLLQDTLISPKSIFWLREKTKHLRTDCLATRKIYLKRLGDSRRSLINSDEVESLVQEYGFEIVVPETLSFSDQVRIFSEASIVIGQAGAALANIVFCNPGALVVPIAVGEGSHADYSVFAKLAQIVNLNLTYFLTNENAADHTYKSFVTFYVDQSSFKQYLDTLNDI
ncbi:glycosyltransferase family 61 protein [Alkalimarinus alittae]|uniref:Glycosyltransferase 61 family protein n=1 Tax=Alkalimarinus alittae TaxID=2961619 RepID=A0ABY6N601_9ALTE|nr:glycosyltransferase 61 family protein [Alkalimarinus alittae]UZE97550.1 glycosyltransferase 61 family protein [Alkalimarinus alittae]